MTKLKFAIRNFVGAIGVFISAFFVAVSGASTMLVIGITAFVAGIFSFGIYNEEDGKKYGPYMLFYGILLILGSIICWIFNLSSWILNLIGGIAVALVGFFQWIKMGNIFGPTKLLRKIEGLAIFVFPVLIIVGVVLSIFTLNLSLGKALIIIGAVIWIIHNLYALILMNSDGEPDLSKFNFDARQSTYNFDKNKILDEDDVRNVVHLIALRWERGRDSLPNGAAVTLYVKDNVNGSNVNFKISGTMHDAIMLPDDKKIVVQEALQRKLQQMQQGIINMTKRELSKYKQLPYTEYNINVELGYFND